jgi:hypothetical protein
MAGDYIGNAHPLLVNTGKYTCGCLLWLSLVILASNATLLGRARENRRITRELLRKTTPIYFLEIVYLILK